MRGCVYCYKMQASFNQVHEELMAEFPDQIRIFKVEGPTMMPLIRKYRIQGYPHLSYFGPNSGLYQTQIFPQNSKRDPQTLKQWFLESAGFT